MIAIKNKTNICYLTRIGRISNITDFGAFVDIGVGKDALVHTSRMRGKKEILSVTNQVSVRVVNIDMSLERISLEII